jgi:hypothetical protein
MPEINFEVRLPKIYYYLICLLTFFVLLWGTIDVVSMTGNYLFSKVSSSSVGQPSSMDSGELGAGRSGELPFEDYYQKRVLFDRIIDGFARILVSGAIFVYARRKVAKLEETGGA